METIREQAAMLLGVTGGLVVAGAVYALLTFLGVVTRIIGRTHTGHLVKVYERIVCAGCTFGAVFSIYVLPRQEIIRLWIDQLTARFRDAVPGVSAAVMNNVFGAGGLAAAFVFMLCAGVYVGCLIMSLAENLNVLPILCRVFRIHNGFPWMIVCLAFGKLLGALLYYWYGW